MPDGVPAARAILAGTVETAVNAVWDAAPHVGDRIAVIGAGMVGASVARVLAGFPAVHVQLVDVDESKAALADALGVGFATPGDARRRLRPRRARERHRGGPDPRARAARPSRGPSWS